jgi:hypothetical protein
VQVRHIDVDEFEKAARVGVVDVLAIDRGDGGRNQMTLGARKRAGRDLDLHERFQIHRRKLRDLRIDFARASRRLLLRANHRRGDDPHENCNAAIEFPTGTNHFNVPPQRPWRRGIYTALHRVSRRTSGERLCRFLESLIEAELSGFARDAGR